MREWETLFLINLRLWGGEILIFHSNWIFISYATAIKMNETTPRNFVSSEKRVSQIWIFICKKNILSPLWAWCFPSKVKSSFLNEKKSFEFVVKKETLTFQNMSMVEFKYLPSRWKLQSLFPLRETFLGFFISLLLLNEELNSWNAFKTSRIGILSFASLLIRFHHRKYNKQQTKCVGIGRKLFDEPFVDFPSNNTSCMFSCNSTQKHRIFITVKFSTLMFHQLKLNHFSTWICTLHIFHHIRKYLKSPSFFMPRFFIWHDIPGRLSVN